MKLTFHASSDRTFISLLSDSDDDDECESIQEVIEASIVQRYSYTSILLYLLIIKILILSRNATEAVNDAMPALADVLQDHARLVVHVAVVPNERQRITVRRRHVWADTKRTLSRPVFKEDMGLNISFIGEQAQDAGGPLREYFRLLWHSLSQDSSLFCGPENQRVVSHNVVALQRKEYEMVGRCISMALSYEVPPHTSFQSQLLLTCSTSLSPVII